MESTENWDDETENGKYDGQAESTEYEPMEQIIPGYSSFDDYVKEVFEVMKAGIKASNNLPSGENYNYYACFPSFVNARNEDENRLFGIMQKLIDIVGATGNIKRRETEEKFDLLVETNDLLLDRAGICMDEESGIVRNPQIELVVTQTKNQNFNSCWNVPTPVSNQQASETSNNSQTIRLLAAKNVQRPQLMFKDKIDNSVKPWQPRIKDKPNSLKPLAIYTEEGEDGEVFCHPYEFELNKFEPPNSQLRKREPVKCKPLEHTPLIMIEKQSDIQILLDDLKKYREIAIDLEHHSYRTFQGITCLMQISTGDTDYIIDTLSLRSELHELNEIFTKRSILKVFHGADLDIQWLQRDLSLYVVNMFDTHQAAKQLNLPYLSLAYLLKRYCGIDPNKHFQLADWRIRPLPDELLKYAREDTHYLLYIKDILANDLIEAANGHVNILKAVYDRSTEICKQTYMKPVWTEESYLNMYRKSQKMFNNKQLYALKELHRWRDITAREEDDSTAYVLPNHMLLNIAETLPREMQGILACCNPIPPLVRQNLLKLHKIILKARDQPLIKPVLEDDLRKRMTQRNHITNSEAWIHSPHDIPSGTEARADLPCLLDNINLLNISISNEVVKHVVTVFDSPVTSENEDGTSKKLVNRKKKKSVFISPFERYKLVMPMVAEEEAKEIEKKRKEEEEERMKQIKQETQDVEESINRVYEHFKKVTELNESAQKSQQKKKNPPCPLSQMHGRKRKRNSNVIKQDVDEKPDNDLSTPVPSLNIKISQGFKTVDENSQEEHLHTTAANIQGNHKNTEQIKPMRQRKKGDKKANEKELMERGMLPAEKFDYKTVDFSSFQGGSMVDNSAKQTKFEQKMQKRRDRARKRRKVKKLNI